MRNGKERLHAVSAAVTRLDPLDLSRFFEQHPTLETERLRLRPITTRDAEDAFAYASDPETTKYMIFPTHESIADTMAWLETVPGAFERKERLSFAITLKSSGKFIGSCSIQEISLDHHSVMIGYILNRNYWGSGYMTEAVGELIRFAFEEMGMHRVAATCDLENVRSARVMERCGMALEGVLRDYELRRGRFVTTKLYSILSMT